MAVFRLAEWTRARVGAPNPNPNPLAECHDQKGSSVVH